MPSILQLQYILAVHQTGHFGHAAEMCGVTQPTLSTQIQKAEESLGLTLFVRQTRPITATENGLSIVEQAQHIVAAHEHMMRTAGRNERDLSGPLSLSIIPTLAPYVVPLFLRAFSERYPSVELTLKERTTDECLADLRSQNTDAALLATPLHEARMTERVLFYDPFYLYAAEGETILENDVLKAKDIDEKKMWLLEDGHCVRHQTLSFCRLKEQSSPLESVHFEGGSFETLKHLIDASGGYTLVPETYARFLSPAVRRKQLRPFNGPIPTREVGLMHLKACWKVDVIDALEAVILEQLPNSLEKARGKQKVLAVR